MRVEIYIYGLQMRLKCAKMGLSDKEMAPQVLEHPGTEAHSHYRVKEITVDERILAQHAQHSPTDQEQEAHEERDCFYCLVGWVFLGSIGHDGEEVVEAIRCQRCKGTARINR
jgi:hypothetical protein